MLFGVIYSALGQGYLTKSYPPILDHLHGTGFMPISIWGIIWLTAGLVAIVSGLFFSPAQDRWGFLGLSCLAFWWGLSYGSGWVFDGAKDGWRTTLVYWAFAAAALIVAGMIDPATVDKMRRNADQNSDQT